jgi:hypothetical protein
MKGFECILVSQGQISDIVRLVCVLLTVFTWLCEIGLSRELV